MHGASTNRKLNIWTVIVIALLAAGTAAAVSGYHMYHVGFKQGFDAEEPMDHHIVTNLSVQSDPNATVNVVTPTDQNETNTLVNLSLCEPRSEEAPTPSPPDCYP